MGKKTVDEKLTYNGLSINLDSMKGNFCPSCGEGVWDQDSYKRYTDAQTKLLELAKRDTRDEIKNIRKRLKLRQKDLAKTFGVGELTISRYERGEIAPPMPFMILLKLIDQHPGLLTEVQQFSEAGSRC
jgi:HTH-type transcriptional regulator/antitoxin MqsA